MPGCRKNNRLRIAAALFGVGACGIVLTAAASAIAQETIAAMAQAQPDPFSALVGKKREYRAERAARGKVERYVLASDDRAFLFEDRSSEARVKFLCAQLDPRIGCMIDPQNPAPEIYILTPTRGPRGDIIYKNTQGDALLRIASYGGATVFWPGEAEGLAASKSFGDDQSLALPVVTYETAARRAQGATAILSAAIGVPFIFDIGAPQDAEGDNAAVLADAVIVTAKAVLNVADDPTGARIIASRIKNTAFIVDTKPGVQLNEAVLEIRYAPSGDIKGRPSSAEIAHFLEESL